MGLDAHQIVNEREHYLEARIQQRIQELETMPSTMSDGSFDTTIDVTQDENVKEDKENDSTMLPLNRLDFRRTRKPTIRDARMTEQLERKQCLERERRAKHEHVEQFSVICSHGRDVIAVNRVAPRQSSMFGPCCPQLPCS